MILGPTVFFVVAVAEFASQSSAFSHAGSTNAGMPSMDPNRSGVGRRAWTDRRRRFDIGDSVTDAGGENRRETEPGFWNVGETSTESDAFGPQSPTPLKPVVVRWQGRRVRIRTAPPRPSGVPDAGETDGRPAASVSPARLRWRGPRDEYPHDARPAKPGFWDAAGRTEPEPRKPKPVDVRRSADAQSRTGPLRTDDVTEPEITVKKTGKLLASR